MVTAGLATCTSCVGPSSFLSVSVARMRSILTLRRAPYIGHSEPLPRAEPLLAQRRRLQAVHAAPGGPDQRGAGEQRAVLADLAVRRLVKVGVVAAGDERAG